MPLSDIRRLLYGAPSYTLHRTSLCFQHSVKDDRKSSTQSEKIPQCSILKLPHAPVLTLRFPATLGKSLGGCWPWVLAFLLLLFLFISLVCMMLGFDCLCMSTAPGLSHCQISMSPSTWMQGLLRCFCLSICRVVTSPVGRERRRKKWWDGKKIKKII